MSKQLLKVSNKSKKKKQRMLASISIIDFEQTLITHRENQRKFYHGQNLLVGDHLNSDSGF